MACKPEFFLPVRVLSRKDYRAKGRTRYKMRRDGESSRFFIDKRGVLWPDGGAFPRTLLIADTTVLSAVVSTC